MRRRERAPFELLEDAPAFPLYEIQHEQRAPDCEPRARGRDRGVLESSRARESDDMIRNSLLNLSQEEFLEIINFVSPLDKITRF